MVTYNKSRKNRGGLGLRVEENNTTITKLTFETIWFNVAKKACDEEKYSSELYTNTNIIFKSSIVWSFVLPLQTVLGMLLLKLFNIMWWHIGKNK